MKKYLPFSNCHFPAKKCSWAGMVFILSLSPLFSISPSFPQLAFAQQTEIEMQYELKPNATDTPFINKATMTVPNAGNFPATACTEIGNVGTKKCITVGGKLAGWPTSGRLTQGPEGSPTHATIFKSFGFEAVDIANVEGTELHATFNGIVKTAYTCPGSCGDTDYGNFVDLADMNGMFQIRYGHMRSVAVHQGETFQRGKVIGTMGSTGNSTGPHVHWEFRGIPMKKPNIPQDITPRDCTNRGPCEPPNAEWDDNLVVDDGSSPGVKSPPEKVLEDYNITFGSGFSSQAVQWAREKLSDVSSTNLTKLVAGTHFEPNPPGETWSSQQSCPGDKDKPANILIDQTLPEELFKITITHELGHIIQNCKPNALSLFNDDPSITEDTHTKIYARLGGLTMYGRHANEVGKDQKTGLMYDCRTNTRSAINENYADMIAYYLNPDSRVKNVCQLPDREPNPYTLEEYAPYKALAERILGKYP